MPTWLHNLRLGIWKRGYTWRFPVEIKRLTKWHFDGREHLLAIASDRVYATEDGHKWNRLP